MGWIKEPKCYDCGMKYNDNGDPVFRDCFVNGWAGGTNNITDKGISIGDFGSLRNCKWDIKKALPKDIWLVNGGQAKLLLANETGQYEIVDFVETEEAITLTDTNGVKHNVCCCEMIFIEWQ